jgi:hypothetical protein
VATLHCAVTASGCAFTRLFTLASQGAEHLLTAARTAAAEAAEAANRLFHKGEERFGKAAAAGGREHENFRALQRAQEAAAQAQRYATIYFKCVWCVKCL